MHRRSPAFASLVLLVLALHGFSYCCGALAPNQLLGTCLTKEWVKSMVDTLKIDPEERDSKGRLKHPFLHAAASKPRYTLADPRTQDKNAFSPSCMPEGAKFHAAGTIVDSNGDVVKPGHANGSIVVELSGWPTHSLTADVFSILAAEVYGYPVSHFFIGEQFALTQRMSSVRSGLCTPTHVNLEVRSGMDAWLNVYANESAKVGSVGYAGLSGLYTTVDFVQDSNDPAKHPIPLNADFWRGYVNIDELIDAVSYTKLAQRTQFFPPKETYCPDGVFGCKDHCSMSHACKLRKDATPSKDCLVVIMMYPDADPGYLQAAMSNLQIPAYFCFMGYPNLVGYVLAMQQAKEPVLFYHFEPDLFHFNFPGLFQRVALPRPIPERVALTIGTFGELGYGEETTNPVDVDFAQTQLAKYASLSILDTQPIGSLVSRFTLRDIDMNLLQREFNTASKDATIVDPTFKVACDWVKANYGIWSLWLDRPSLCALGDHVDYSVTGCQNTTEARVITFGWKQPDPEDPTKPNNCDGGLNTLPQPLRTSRSCEWINADPSKWQPWITNMPECDDSFFDYRINSCDAQAKRSVHFYWLLPNTTDPSKSLECSGGTSLPTDVNIDCEYMPTTTTIFKVLAGLHCLLIVMLVVSIGFVIYNRNRPIIRRSQFELLVLMMVGGIMICIAALLYGGKPSRFSCAARPFLVSIGFTTIFGSLVVKSLRVYRVFMKSSLKRVTVTALMMFKILAIFEGVDILILLVWFLADFPQPTVLSQFDRQLGGDIDHITCKSSSFLFSAVLMFWKAIVLFSGIYLSFLIRHVSADFQESIWIFSSSVVVLVSCLVVLPLAYVVALPASVFYVFFSAVLFLSTASVMGMMLVPKMFRLQEVARSSTNTSTESTNMSRNRAQSRVAAVSSMRRSSGGTSTSPSVEVSSKVLIVPTRNSQDNSHRHRSGIDLKLSKYATVEENNAKDSEDKEDEEHME
ncbi:hypothetical protein Poli38472_007714 [Pythium oligandrum]|uniref:G-protein coupled receptors family 3 profile domain-containing protein n=1 Tax=Pythium oligandrum TaxID=41045 RepID=A0A8K1FQK5_PYTOL|nr:hypothetical protein Poli38472_007714 [Pythium oligandrum]|eukprot:TMW68042.1 hypothetical protein Poli38472_007714 [Pythium oligandrum]